MAGRMEGAPFLNESARHQPMRLAYRCSKLKRLPNKRARGWSVPSPAPGRGHARSRRPRRRCLHVENPQPTLVGTSIANSLAGCRRRSPARRWSAPPCPVSTIPSIPTAGSHRTGCACGAHRSQAEHDDAQRQLQCAAVESEEQRYQGVVASAVMRAVFPRDAARRAFLKVGRRVDRARRALAVLPARRPRPRCSRRAARSRRRTSRSASSRSPAPRRSSWRTRWASTASTA